MHAQNQPEEPQPATTAPASSPNPAAPALCSPLLVESFPVIGPDEFDLLTQRLIGHRIGFLKTLGFVHEFYKFCPVGTHPEVITADDVRQIIAVQHAMRATVAMLVELNRQDAVLSDQMLFIARQLRDQQVIIEQINQRRMQIAATGKQPSGDPAFGMFLVAIIFASIVISLGLAAGFLLR